MVASVEGVLIRNEGTGLVLAVEQGSPVQVDGAQGGDTQYWQVVAVGGAEDVYHLKNVGTGKFLVVAFGGVLQEVAQATGAWAEQWQARPVPGRADVYYLVNRSWEAQPLSAIPPGGQGYPGVILYPDYGQPNQWWTLPPDALRPEPRPVIASGRTTPGEGWTQDKDDKKLVYLDVDTSSANFTSTPNYVVSLGGSRSMCTIGGGTSSVYNPSPTGFRVHLRNWNDTELSAKKIIDNRDWYVSWIGMQN